MAAELGLKGPELRAALAKLRSYLAEGMADEECALKLGVSWDLYEQIRKQMIESEINKIRTKPTEVLYVEYMLEQQANIHDLTKMIGHFSTTKQFNAMVGAVKARSEILDKIIDRGQGFGIIEKKPERREIVAGILVRNMTNEQLKKRITAELGDLGKLMRLHGDASMDDIEVGPIHRADPDAEEDGEIEEHKALPAPKIVPAKVKAHSRTPVRGGRKVVKTKAKAV
jgi:hypothetical protein